MGCATMGAHHLGADLRRLQDGVLSHIAVGGGWTTEITLINRATNSGSETVVLNLHDESGKPLALIVAIT